MKMAGRAGLMSSEDKKKLDEYSAVTHENGKFMAADGSWAVPKDEDSWSIEHLSIAGGANGLDVKRASGVVEFTIPFVSTTGAGVLTAADKIKLDGAATVGHVHAAGDITSGTLAVARGGTGLTSSPSMLTNLASTSAANVMAASPRPGVTGTLPIANGGTGATTAANALTKLGAAAATHNHDGAYASSTHVHAASEITSGTLAIANGGTGASDTATALTNLGAAVSGHKHAAGDITSGTLAVARGGTGQTTLAKARNAMGLGNTTGALPVANGGTGAKTAAAALTNLGAAAAEHSHSGYATLTFTQIDSGTCRIELNGVS